MEVSQTLKKAWAAVEEAGLPEKIQEVAFREAVRLLVPAPVVDAPTDATPLVWKPGGGTGSSSGEGSNGDTGITVSEDEIYARVATHTGVDRDRLEQIVHLDGEATRRSRPCRRSRPRWPTLRRTHRDASYAGQPSGTA